MRITSKIRIPLFVRWTALAVVCAIGIGGIGYGVNDALNESARTREIQVDRCEQGNKLKVGLQDYFQEQLDEVESHGVKYYENFLGGSEAEIRKLRKESITKLRKDVNDRFAPEDCVAVIKGE